MKCYIMRGLPGSGKSHWIKKELVFSNPPLIVSADDFWINNKGEYVFDPLRIGEAHNYCLREFIEMSYVRYSLNQKEPRNDVIIVDNTNIRMYEIAPYYRIAEALGFEVEIIWILCDPQICLKRNIHQVPESVINSMFKSFEPISTKWNMRMVFNNG